MAARTAARRAGSGNPRRRRKKKFAERAVVAEDPGPLVGLDLQKPSLAENGHHEDGMELSISKSRSVVESVCENTVVEPAPEPERSQVSCVSFVELRQRNVNGSVGDEPGDEEAGITRSRTADEGKWPLMVSAAIKAGVFFPSKSGWQTVDSAPGRRRFLPLITHEAAFLPLITYEAAGPGT